MPDVFCHFWAVYSGVHLFILKLFDSLPVSELSIVALYSYLVKLKKVLHLKRNNVVYYVHV